MLLLLWWGTSHSTESTPNLLTHELHHAVTGFVHGGDHDPDPCWTPAVGEPTAACGRGFDMDLGGDLTAAKMCEAVVDGWSGHDYTH